MIASGSGVPVMMATLIVGVVIVVAAFTVRRLVLRTDGALPRQPSKLWALAFGRSSSPAEEGSAPSTMADPPVTLPEPERPDVVREPREPGSAAT